MERVERLEKELDEAQQTISNLREVFHLFGALIDDQVTVEEFKEQLEELNFD